MGLTEEARALLHSMLERKPQDSDGVDVDDNPSRRINTMCLAVPMKLVEIYADGRGVADVDGTRYDVNLSLVNEPAVGDHVIVHAGYAIEKLDEHEAEQRLSLFSLMASLQRREGTA